jgi:hypothetical protein
MDQGTAPALTVAITLSDPASMIEIVLSVEFPT